jgi:ubiquitin carboxyl-terminal hydrolase 4/11
LEIFNHRFYKNLDDNTICSDLAENDIIVCYELPCNSQQSRAYKKSPEDPLIVPVFLSDIPPRQRYNSTHNYFGYPFLIALDHEQVKNKDAIYDFVLERLQRWTAQARDLYRWEPGPGSTPMEEVPIALSAGPSLESVTEIKENGDVVTVQEVAPEEDDIVNQKGLVIEDQVYMDMGNNELQCIGFKRNIFNALINPGSTQYSTGYGSFNTSKMETLDQRAEAASDKDAELIHEGDTILAEFDEHTKAYYFGEPKTYEHAKWALWEDFVHPEVKAAREATSQKKTRGISLQDCLDEFTKEEQLGEDDLWYCPRCKKHQQATKRFDLWSIPDILVVHLKRFSNSRILRDKIDTFVDFPLTGLDLTSMTGQRKAAQRLADAGEDPQTLGLDDVEEPLIYDVFAVDEHIGGLGGGHYRAYAYNTADEKWYHFDDSYVTPAQPEAAVVCLSSHVRLFCSNMIVECERLSIVLPKTDVQTSRWQNSSDYRGGA